MTRPAWTGRQGTGCMDATTRRGEAHVTISRDAILHNVKVIRSRLRPGTRLCAVVKADAYGHDAHIVADTLCNFSYDALEGPAVDALAVATLEEADSLGPAPVPVHVLRPVEAGSIRDQRQMLLSAVRTGRVLTVVSAPAAADLGRLAAALGRPAAVQIMIDTGHAREGAAPHDVPAVLAAVAAQPALRLAAVCTHLVSSEQPDDPFTAHQLAMFRRIIDNLAPAAPLVRHVANSGGVFLHPESHFDMVRPGISIYGIDPTGRPTAARPLRPAMKWTAPLLMTRRVSRGQSVGYNRTWVAPRDTTLGLVGVGYADGYMRCFSNRAVMIVRGRTAPVVGRVNMDYTTIDLHDVPDAVPGDQVTVMDSDPLSPASVYALAQLADTIPYEILCRIGPRMSRVVLESQPAAADEPEAPAQRRQAV